MYEHLSINGFPGRSSPAILTKRNIDHACWVYDAEDPESEPGFAQALLTMWDHGGFRLHLYANVNGGRTPIFIAERNGGVVGEYRQLPPSPYNLPCGNPRVIVEPVDLAAAMRELERDADPRRLPVLQPVCEDCGRFDGMATEGAIKCRGRGVVSLSRGSCPDGKWIRPLLKARLDARAELSPNDPIEVVGEIIDTPPTAWPPGAPSWPNVQEAYRQEFLRQYMNVPDYPEEAFAGKGILIVGGGKYFDATYVTVRAIRRSGCNLPIEVWHLPGEMTERESEILKGWGVKTIDAGAFENQLISTTTPGGAPPRVMAGWPLKALAVLNCRFRKLIYLDADSYPVTNPAKLIDCRDPDGRKRVAVFWPDNTLDDLKPLAWELAGLAPRVESAFESGQFYVDKKECWPALWLAWWLNDHSDYWYNIPDPHPRDGRPRKLFYGDKDLFHIAMRRCGIDYAMPHRRPLWVDHTYQHYDLDSQLLFQHRCRDKFALTRRKRGMSHFTNTYQVYGHNHYDSRLQLEDFCFDALEDLRDEMDGIWRTPAIDRREHIRLIDRRLRKIAIGQGTRGYDVELKADGRIKGDDGIDRRWRVRGKRIVFDGPRGPAYFDPDPESGGYVGHREGRPILLLPYTEQPLKLTPPHKPEYELYCCYHKNVYPEFYGKDLERVTFAKLGGCESEFRPPRGLPMIPQWKGYGRHYAEYELLFNLYHAVRFGTNEIAEYVGFVQYDMNLVVGGQSVFDFIDDLPLHPDMVVAFYPLVYEKVVVNDLRLRTREGVGFRAGKKRGWVHRVLEEHNAASGESLTVQDLQGTPFAMCTGFLLHRDLFMDMMRVLEYVRLSGYLDQPEHCIGSRIAGGILERLSALYLATRDELEWRKFKLPHLFLAGAGKDER